MILRNAIIHGIAKAPQTKVVALHPRAQPLPIDGRLERLAGEVLRIYSGASNGYGTFENDHSIHPFPNYLRRYIQRETEFIEFSTSLLQLIADKMRQAFLSTGGYVLVLRYENLSRDWLLVVMLKLKERTGINEETLDLVDSLSLDVEHLHEAARIDIQKWLDNTQPYLSFIKRSGSGEQVTEYFREALGCLDYTDSKHHTQQLLSALDAYCAAKGKTGDARLAVRNIVFDYCVNKTNLSEPVNLTALSAFIDDQSPTDFSAFVRDNNIPISEIFDPHKQTYKRLHRLQGKFGNVSIGFDVDDLTSGVVSYDSTTHSLKINRISPELEREIQRVLSDESSAQ